MSIINIKTNREIDESRIVSDNDKGIVYSNKKSWKYIPSQNIRRTVEYKDSYYYKKEELEDNKNKKEAAPLLLGNNDITDFYVNKAQYKFGVEFNTLSKINPYNESAIISEEINLNNFSYITISVEQELENVIVEYWLYYNGTRKEEIIPQNTSLLQKERLFNGVSTRFLRNETTEKPKIYEDKSLTEKSIHELTKEDFENHKYYIEYIPLNDYTKIIPKSSKIRLGLTIRILDDKDYICNIKNIVVNKYGGEIKWN